MRSEKIVGNVEQRKYFSSQERRSIHRKPINYDFGIRFLISDEAKYSF